MHAEQPELPAGQRLCVACGLCCRGVWFSHALMSADEVEKTRTLGLTIQPPDSEGQLSFSLPCHHHQGGQCSIYGSWRPAVCGSYRCALLFSVEEGATPVDVALKTVATAKSLADEILAETGPVEGGIVGDAFLKMANGAPSGGNGDLSPLARLNAGALRVIYLRHFDTASRTGGAAVDAPGSDKDTSAAP